MPRVKDDLWTLIRYPIYSTARGVTKGSPLTLYLYLPLFFSWRSLHDLLPPIDTFFPPFLSHDRKACSLLLSIIYFRSLLHSQEPGEEKSRWLSNVIPCEIKCNQYCEVFVFVFENTEQNEMKQVPRGYIRCDYSIVTYCFIVYRFGDFVFKKNDHIRQSKLTRDRWTDGQMDGQTDGRSRPLIEN